MPGAPGAGPWSRCRGSTAGSRCRLLLPLQRLVAVGPGLVVLDLRQPREHVLPGPDDDQPLPGADGDPQFDVPAASAGAGPGGLGERDQGVGGQDVGDVLLGEVLPQPGRGGAAALVLNPLLTVVADRLALVVDLVLAVQPPGRDRQADRGEGLAVAAQLDAAGVAGGQVHAGGGLGRRQQGGVLVGGVVHGVSLICSWRVVADWSSRPADISVSASCWARTFAAISSARSRLDARACRC